MTTLSPLAKSHRVDAELFIGAGEPSDERERCGSFRRCYNVAATAIRLSLHYPDWFPDELGCAYYLTARYDKAIDAQQRSLDRSPENGDALTLLAAAQSAAGHVGPARQILANLSSCAPFTRRKTTHVGEVYKNNDDLNRILDHLRNAGLVRLIQYHPGPALDFEIITTSSKVISIVVVTRASLCLRSNVMLSLDLLVQTK